MFGMEQSVIDPAVNFQRCVGSAVVKILKMHSGGFVTFLETHPFTPHPPRIRISV